MVTTPRSMCALDPAPFRCRAPQRSVLWDYWWTHQDLNLGPLACEASALTGLSYASAGDGIIAPRRLARKSLTQSHHGNRRRASVIAAIGPNIIDPDPAA